ncbi:MAG TPA: type II secretion system protein [Gemmatimonadales bacterium]|jgi:prepilin-type N-terminal cleavage/methylation domain-containing protein
MKQSERGLTVVEILVALVILGIGLLVLAGGSVVVTRDLTRSGLATVANARAQAKLDELMTTAGATEPRCGSANFASSVSATTINKITLSWTITPNAGAQRTVRIITSYQLPGNRQHTDTLRALIGC